MKSTADDLIHTDTFLLSSQEVTDARWSPEGHLFDDEAVKWLDQFIVCLKYFVKRKIKLSLSNFFAPDLGKSLSKGSPQVGADTKGWVGKALDLPTRSSTWRDEGRAGSARKIKRGVIPPSGVRLDWGGLRSETLESGSLENGKSAGLTEGAALRESAH